MAELTNLKIWACYYYHQMGFNITHIIPSILEYNRDDYPKDKKLFKKNPFKSSANKRENFDVIRQSYSEIESFNWQEAKGIGTVTGLNSLRALDFDNCSSIEFIKSMLELLELPIDYEWVVNTGSKKGFHIIFYSDLLFEFPCYKSRIRYFKPNNQHLSKFKKLDLIWKNHLILPPSLHHSGNKYEFVFTDLPLKKPQFVSWYKIEEMIRIISFENGKPLTYFNGNTEDFYGVIIDNHELKYFKNNGLFKDNENSLAVYYSKICNNIDFVYKKEHYKLGLENLKDIVQNSFKNKNIIEIACGNGFWTSVLSKICNSILATDINESCITEARKNVISTNITFEIADCFNLDLSKKFDGLFGGFIISHVSRKHLYDFFRSINRCLKPGSIVLLFDNTLNTNNNMNIDATNESGDTLQKRYTNEGEEFLIIKNFFKFDELKAILSPIAYEIEFNKLQYFWSLKYKVK